MRRIKKKGYRTTYLDQNKLKGFQKKFLSQFIVDDRFIQQTEYSIPVKYQLLVEYGSGYIFNNLIK